MTGNTKLDPNITALTILKNIVKSKGTTLYGISKSLKVPTSKVGYHLPDLEGDGLILSEDIDGVKIYIPQPILVDFEFSSVVEKAIDDIYLAAGNNPEKIHVKSEKIEDIEIILENCIRAKIALAISDQ